MNAKQIAGYFITIVMLGTVGYGLTSFMWVAPSPAREASYMNTTYGISFLYPDSYAIVEKEVGNGERGHFLLTLTEKDVATPRNGESPPSIALDVYQNNHALTVEKWIRNTGESNFKLSGDGKLNVITVAGEKGLYYRWDGLYQGESAVIGHKDNVVVFSATFIAPDDQIRQDFGKILGSVVLN